MDPERIGPGVRETPDAARGRARQDGGLDRSARAWGQQPAGRARVRAAELTRGAPRRGSSPRKRGSRVIVIPLDFGSSPRKRGSRVFVESGFLTPLGPRV